MYCLLQYYFNEIDLAKSMPRKMKKIGNYIFYYSLSFHKKGTDIFLKVSSQIFSILNKRKRGLDIADFSQCRDEKNRNR